MEPKSDWCDIYDPQRHKSRQDRNVTAILSVTCNTKIGHDRTVQCPRDKLVCLTGQDCDWVTGPKWLIVKVIASGKMLNRFDSQAEQFDCRAGLPEVVCRKVARTMAEVASTPREGVLLEVGAGTGQIGQYLQELPYRYLGFDISNRMLQIFRERMSRLGAEVELIEADGNRRWPAPDSSTVITFSSRTLHLLDTEHVVQEVYRVTGDYGGTLIVGSIHRDPDCVHAEMRRQMRQFLQELGIQGRGGEQSRQTLFDRCSAHAGVLLEPVTAATWEAEHTPQRSIESWESKPGLAGVEVSQEVKHAVLGRLRRWALQRFGDLRRPSVVRQTYRLEGVQIPPRET